MDNKNESYITETETDISLKIDELKEELKLVELEKKFYLKEALLNVARLSSDNYSIISKAFDKPSDEKVQKLKRQEAACIDVFGDITLDFVRNSYITEKVVRTIYILKGSYSNVDVEMEFELQKEIKDMTVNEYIYEIFDVTFKPVDDVLDKVSTFFKSADPSYAQMIPSLLLNYMEIKLTRDEAVQSITNDGEFSVTSEYQISLDIPLPVGEGAILYWKFYFDDAEFIVRDDIIVEVGLDILNLYVQHESFDILSKKKVLINADDVIEFFKSFAASNDSDTV